jgi:hypothetical protein
MVRIVIGSDVCPMGSLEPLFVAGDAPAIFHDLLEAISSADLSVVNLECPLVSRSTPINKAGGAVLKASADCIRGFSAARWQLLNLANNHSFDQGADGLTETLSTVRQAGLAVVGAGRDIHDAKAPFVTHIAGQRIVIYSMAEREYSVAGDTEPGSNPLDLINLIEAIAVYKQGGAFVVLFHGGTDCPYPSPEMVRRCRFIVDMGADAVICSHPHRPLPWEFYRGRPIAYGMGNFVFEELRNPLQNPPPGWHEGYLVTLTLVGGQVGFLPVPYFQCRPVLGALRMDRHSEQRFLAEMEERGKRLSEPSFLKTEWLAHCARERESYLSDLFGYSRWVRKASRLLGVSLHSHEDVLNALLLSQCETHLEVLNSLFREARQRRSQSRSGLPKPVHVGTHEPQ